MGGLIAKSLLAKLKTEDGRIVTSKPELLGEIEKFYGELYTSTHASVVNLAYDPRTRLTRHYTDDIPDISMYETVMALKQLKNDRYPVYPGEHP